MQRWKVLAMLMGVLLALPYTLLMAAGCVWLYQNGLLPLFLAVTSVAMLLGWVLTRLLKRTRSLKSTAGVQPAGNWPPAGEAAWREVERIADRAQANPPPLDEPDQWWRLLREVMIAVAKQFHPKSDQPALEVPLPDALQIVELVSHDLRTALRERVPGSHMLTINDFNRIKRLAAWWEPLYAAYRLAYLGFNPIAAVVREVRDVATGQMMSVSADEIHRWATAFCVRKAGFYAIQLYSGQLNVDEETFRSYTTKESRRQSGEASERDEHLAGEPLRILVLGQTKAGKSSLINALFGEVRAATDVIPLTTGIDPFVLEREGLPRTIILDTAGYAAAKGGTPIELDEALLKTDLVLLVCSARSAAREPDRAILADLRERFERDRHRAMPPVVVVLTHIDSLRPFNEWSPPYNLASPTTSKAQAIAAAVQAVADDLSMPDDHVVPVCLLPERRYNVDDGLMPAMLGVLPKAERAKLLRTLRQFRDEEYWQLLWQQAANTGRFLAKAGTAWAERKTDELARRITGR